ncbi:MAG: PP2C family protein-serine/threonine phosphatase [Solirubrobacteraceae bacterium]
MSGGSERESDARQRPRPEPQAGDDEVTRLRKAAEEDARTIEALRGAHDQDAATIHQLEEEAVASDRIERAQRALIDELRAEVGDAAHDAEAIGKRLRAAELELVDLRAVRDALLEPALVQREGMTIAAEVIPGDPLVGGDFFFVGDGANGTTVMAVGDVAGKGLSAVRRSAFTRTALASVAPFSDDPCRLLRWVNVALVERVGESAEFVTAACLTYDPRSRLLRLAVAGHHPALRLASGAELTAEHTGVALGIAREVNCSASAHRLGEGDGVLLYTDGLTEARGERTRYGIDRLSALLRDRAELAPQDTLEILKRDLRRFAGEQLTDDVCLLVLQA